MKAIPYPLRGEWLISDEGADLVMQVWRTAQTTGKAERIALALEAREGKPLANQHNFVTLPSGIVVMDVDGPLMRKAELFSDISGATSYQWISARLDDCRASSSAVRKLVIRANSPGGEAAGVGECGEKIVQLIASGWHVEGYVETQAASAMWWLLSQCSHITAHPTAQVGWIGAVRRLIDDSERDEKAGVKVHEVISKGAEKKRTLPMDDAVIARVQSNTDEWGALFTEAVARGRGVTPAAVLKDFGGGAGMFAAAALDVGMVDDVANFEDTIARLTGARTSTSSPAAARAHRGETMAIEKTLTAGGDSEWQCAGCNEMMGVSAKSYCAKCADDGDEDDDEDEDEAKALGLEPKATAAQRRERMVALVVLEERVLAATEAKTHAAAMGRLAAVIADVAEVPALRTELAKTKGEDLKRDLRSTLERGLMGAPGKVPTLSLGKIQREMATSLRGEPKKLWRAAMDKLAADAEAAPATEPEKKKITAAQIIEAACSVPVTADDVEAIREFVQTSAPVAAALHIEPERNGTEESAELDASAAEVARLANQARAVLDRNNPKPPAAK